MNLSSTTDAPAHAAKANRDHLMRLEEVDHRFSKPEVLFFGVGAQKAGTSWLHVFLNSHPEVCVPAGKEMHYWTRVEHGNEYMLNYYRDLLAKRRESGAGNIRKIENRIRFLEVEDSTHSKYADVLFHRYNGQKVVGEITPDYSNLSRKAFSFLSQLNKDTRFLFLMRDPIERLHSAIRKSLRNAAGGDRSAEISEKQILAELHRIAKTNSAAIKRSRYDRTIIELEAAVAREKIGYFFYEDIFTDKNVDGICDFLSISRMDGDFKTQVNPGNPRTREMDPEFRDVSLKLIGEVYGNLAERFGDKLPAAWRQHV